MLMCSFSGSFHSRAPAMNSNPIDPAARSSIHVEICVRARQGRAGHVHTGKMDEIAHTLDRHHPDSSTPMLEMSLLLFLLISLWSVSSWQVRLPRVGCHHLYMPLSACGSAITAFGFVGDDTTCKWTMNMNRAYQTWDCPWHAADAIFIVAGTTVHNMC